MTAKTNFGAAHFTALAIHNARRVWFLSRTALFKRYCGSLVGVGWSLLHPAAQIGILSFAFLVVLRVPIENYVVFLSSGLLPWTFLTAALNLSTNSLINRVDELNATMVPRYVYVLADVAVELLSFLIAFGIFLAVALLFFQAPGVYLTALPLAMLPLIIVAFSGGVILAYLSAIFRDIPHLLGVSLGIVFWLVPIVYHWSMAPPAVAIFVQYNPVALLFSPMQIVMHGRTIPSVDLFLASYAMAFVLALIAWWIYRRLDRRIIYYL